MIFLLFLSLLTLLTYFNCSRERRGATAAEERVARCQDDGLRYRRHRELPGAEFNTPA